MKSIELVNYRKQQELTQYLLADKLGVSRGAVAHWEQAEELPAKVEAWLLNQLKLGEGAPLAPLPQEARAAPSSSEAASSVKTAFEQRIESGITARVDSFLLEVSDIATQALQEALRGG
jgi:transcriptional regulator with XRE-family HTH domain